MSEAGNAFLISAVTVGLAGAVGYGIYRLALPKGQAVTPIQIGRKWFAWMAMIATFTALPRFVQTLDVLAFINWLVVLVFYGGLAFAVGWLYGRFVKSKPIGIPA